jgi:HK97 family phage major capsid protein
MTDSEVDLGSYLGQELGARIGQLEETAYMTGDGSGKPLGIAHASSGVTVYTLPAGQVTTLTYAAWVDAIGQLPTGSRSSTWTFPPRDRTRSWAIRSM